MANPQKEDGFTPIANEILEALARIRIPGTARQVLDVIIRKTYGWGKKSDKISLSQIVEATGLRREHVIHARTRLIKMGLIIAQNGSVAKNGNGNNATYWFNKDYDKWEGAIKHKKVAKNGNAYKNYPLPNLAPTKETILGNKRFNYSGAGPADAKAKTGEEEKTVEPKPQRQPRPSVQKPELGKVYEPGPAGEFLKWVDGHRGRVFGIFGATASKITGKRHYGAEWVDAMLPRMCDYIRVNPGEFTRKDWAAFIVASLQGNWREWPGQMTANEEQHAEAVKVAHRGGPDCGMASAGDVLAGIFGKEDK